MQEEVKNPGNPPETVNEPATTESVAPTHTVVGVQFSAAGKVHSFIADNLDLSIHDIVVVEGEKGAVMGTIIVPPKAVIANELATNTRKVLRRASEEDIAHHNQNRETSLRAFRICEEKISEKALPMKLIDVNILEGDTKMTFYFTAEERVDFRSLVKDLANALHMRIEMRQIGARDEAKSVGSIGTCGQVCCCNRHLREFQSISLQMAKNQGLAPNPQKLTGQCGKLKCCLFYENELYTECRRELPTLNSKVKIAEGIGYVTNVDVLRKICQIRLDNEKGDMFSVTPDKIEEVLEKGKPRKGREKPRGGDDKPKSEERERGGRPRRDDRGRRDDRRPREEKKQPVEAEAVKDEAVKEKEETKNES